MGAFPSGSYRWEGLVWVGWRDSASVGAAWQKCTITDTQTQLTWNGATVYRYGVSATTHNYHRPVMCIMCREKGHSPHTCLWSGHPIKELFLNEYNWWIHISFFLFPYLSLSTPLLSLSHTYTHMQHRHLTNSTNLWSFPAISSWPLHIVHLCLQFSFPFSFISFALLVQEKGQQVHPRYSLCFSLVHNNSRWSTFIATHVYVIFQMKDMSIKELVKEVAKM